MHQKTMIKPLENDDMLDAFRRLYKKEAPVLIAYAAGFTDREAAEDIVQDIFLKLWDKRAFVFLNDGIRTYLFSAVRHACLDYLKHIDVQISYEHTVRLKLKIDELYFNDDPDFLMHADARLPAVYREIEKLPARCREIFIMAYLEERKSTEIATLLSVSKRTVEAHLYKGLQAIRKALGNGA
jgi:RNA polymerase sigma-70 factor (ECF subfamily)